jgi:hypothetical protein
MSERVVLRVAELRNAVAGQMQDFAGNVHDILSITHEQHQGLMATHVANPDAPTPDEMTRVRRLVEQLVPTLSKEEILKYNLEICKAITATATAGIKAVESAYPNAVGPASMTSPA